jgi:hypothetical protein
MVFRAKRSNLAFRDEIATPLSGARNDGLRKGFPFLNRNLGVMLHLTNNVKYDIKFFLEPTTHHYGKVCTL